MDYELILALLTLASALPSAALLLLSSSPGTWRRHCHAAGLAVGLLLAYGLLVEFRSPTPQERWLAPELPRELTWSCRCILTVVGFGVLVGLFGHTLDRVPRVLPTSSSRWSSATYTLGGFGLALGLLLGSLATGVFCGIPHSCDKPPWGFNSLFEPRFITIRLPLLSAATIALWYCGTLVGTWIDKRQARTPASGHA